MQGRDEGGKGSAILKASSNYGGAKSLWRAQKSTNNVTSTFFHTEHLLPKDLSFEHGGPNLLLALGAI